MMRKSVSAPNLNLTKMNKHSSRITRPPSPKTNHPIVCKLMKINSSKNVQKCRNAIIVGSTVLMGYANYEQRVDILYVSNTLMSIICLFNILISYIENYTLQIDQWREEESCYEEKLDPPLWNWKIIKVSEHVAIILWLCGAILEDISIVNNQVFNLAFIVQIAAVTLNAIDSGTVAKSSKTLFCFGSLICFSLYNTQYNIQYLLYGTVFGVISETFTIFL